MWKNMPEPDKPTENITKRMRFAWWINKAIDQHPEYIILIVVPTQQWLHEGAPMLDHMHVAFIVNVY